MNKISIIVPAYNEEKNLLILIQRTHEALTSNNIVYEIIIVDDHSTDKTQIITTHLSKYYPVRLHIKKGERGKASSLIQGFSKAKYELICMIDADLQYPPEAIPGMIKKINRGADFVVTNRNKHQTNIIRKFISRSQRFFLGKLLHGFDEDVQSGLKLFKKEIIERIDLKIGVWAIDLELLTKAKNAGYKIESHNILFKKRQSGKTKINLFKASWEIGLNALKLKFLPNEIIPLHPKQEEKRGKGFHYKGQEFIHHSSLSSKHIALHSLSNLQKFIITTLFIDFILGLIINWHLTLEIFIGALSVLYFADLLFNLYLIFRSYSKPAEITITDEEIQKINDNDWPTYTIFCPLYKEWQVVPQFVNAMKQLDYPKEKLQVMLLLEEDDKETIEKIQEMSLPSYFDTVIVPHSKPKTKPKACNYGLKFATGEYIVIYDAEDAPEPDQLKKAVLAFKKAGKKTVCIQAKLNFYNPHQNLLTRIFTAEYSLWFDLILTGLQSINAPIPLGGTSNHFKAKELDHIKGWDSFNVTEDADLGIRLVKAGYKTAIVDSTTYEEANSDYLNWFNQRTRWIKGYIQTYFVHMRTLNEFSSSRSKLDKITFQLIIGGKILSMFINPIMWIVTLSYFIFRSQIGTIVESFFPGPILYISIFSLIFGNFLYFYYYLMGCIKREHDEIVKYLFLVPFYWLAMSLSAWKATFEFIRKPHYWSKTKHGLHLNNEKNGRDQQIKYETTTTKVSPAFSNTEFTNLYID